MRIASLSWIVLAVTTALGGCGYGDQAEDPLANEDLEESESALVGNLAVGMQLETTARLNLRSGPSTGTSVLLTMPLGATVTLRQAAPKGGFYAISYGSRTGWAHGGYLVSADGSGVEDDTATGPAPAPGVTRTVRISGPAVRSHVQGFANASCTANGCPNVIGTRAGHSPTADRAIDMMESTGGRRPADGGAHGTRVAAFGLASGDRHKVMYVIWQQRINSLDGRGWRGMADRGSITQNHYDHVHVSFDP